MSIAMFPDVTVNGTTIPSADIAGEAQNHEAPKGKPGLAWRKAARALIVRQLLLDEALRRGIEATPEEVGPGRSETPEEATIRALMEEAIDAAEPTDAAIRAEWDKAPERFRAPPLWEASHILCACEPGEHEGAVKAQARAQILQDGLAKGHKFADLAASDSDCGSKSNGGALGQLGPGDTVPEFEAVLRVLTEGETSPVPVRTRFGWHILRLDACAEGAVLPFDIVRPKLAEAMEKAAWAQSAKRFVDTLVEAADIVGIDLQNPI